MKTRTAIAITIATALLPLACSKGSESSATQPSATAPTPPPLPSTPPSASAAPAQKIEVQLAAVGNLMLFSKTALTVPTGAEVHLVLKNPATMATMPHNWVLLATQGTQARIAAEGLAKAPDAGYVVPGPDILAYTPLAPPGGTTEVTFTAPAPGKYPYICTVPGHYMQMKGVLTVTP